MTSAKDIKEAAFYPLGFDADGNVIGKYIFDPDLMQAFEEAILQDYDDYMTDRISREPGKIFDRKECIKEFIKHLNS